MSTKIQCTVLWVSVSVHVVVPKQRIKKTLSNYAAKVYDYLCICIVFCVHIALMTSKIGVLSLPLACSQKVHNYSSLESLR